MTVRVNLLKPSEFRRQGAVSGPFMLRASILSGMAFTLLFGMLGFVNFQIAREDLAACKQVWAIRKPMYDQIMAMREDMATQKKIQQELKGWQVSRVNWTRQLHELQDIVPASLQLKRLGIRGELEMKLKSAPVPAEGEAAPEAPPTLGTPTRRFFINMEGKATGQMAESVVVQFVRTIGSARTFKQILDSIKLQSMQKENSTADQGEQADRVFSIEASTLKREMK